MLFEINSQNIRCCHTFLKSLKVPYKCYLTDQLLEGGQSFFPCNQGGNNQELMLVKWGYFRNSINRIFSIYPILGWPNIILLAFFLTP